MSSKPAPHVSSAEEIKPRRVLGFRDLLLFYIVTGISLRWISFAAASGPSAVVIWLGAFLVFYLPLASSVIVLSSRYPQEGGLYVWSREAFGPFAGFIAAWSYWTSNIPYFPSVLYFAAGNALFVGGTRWQQLSASPTFYISFALGSLIFISVLNLLGLEKGTWIHNLGALGMWLPILILLMLAIFAARRFGMANSFAPANCVPHLDFRNLIIWSTIAFALCGCETASFMGEEIKDARRNVPRALLLAGAVVMTTYIAGSIAILLVVPADAVSPLQGVMQAVTNTATHLGLAALIPLVAALVSVSNLGAAGAYLASVGRLPFAAGVDHILPQAFAKLHPRWRTPHVALLLQLVVAAIFIFLSQAGTSVEGAYEVLVSTTVITTFLPFLLVFGAMVRMQFRPAPVEAARVPGGKPVSIFLGILGFATTSLTIILSVIPGEQDANKPLAVLKIVGLSLLLLAAGAVLYCAARSKSTASS